MVLDEEGFDPSSRFHAQVTTVLVGIAVQRGEAPGEVAALLAALRG
jgi:hypothetical protein